MTQTLHFKTGQAQLYIEGTGPDPPELGIKCPLCEADIGFWCDVVPIGIGRKRFTYSRKLGLTHHVRINEWNRKHVLQPEELR